MEYNAGDDVIVPMGKFYRRARIMAALPKDNKYYVSVDNGNGGFHYVREQDILTEDKVMNADIYDVEGKVPSWILGE